MEARREVAEEEDEELLQADAALVDVQPEQDLRGRHVVARSGRGAAGLDQKGEDVEQDEVEAKAPGFDFEESGGRMVVVDHAAEDHVDEGVGPERGDEDEDEPGRVGGVRGRGSDGGDAEGVGEGLPKCGHADYPAVGFAVEDGLSNVGQGDEAEENGVEVGGRDGRAERPEGV